jgi:hypothetical protein
MKRVVLTAVALLLLAGPLLAQSPDSTYVGLFYDLDRTIPSRIDYVVADPPHPTPFYMYIFFLPGARGLYAASYSLIFPDNIQIGTVTNYTGLFTLGDIVTGISVVWPDSCRYEWTYSQRVRCYLNDDTQSRIEIGPRQDTHDFLTSNCDLMDEPYIKFTYLYLNYDGGLGTVNKSWGAIKSLYR